MKSLELLRDPCFNSGFTVGTIDGTLARMKGPNFGYGSITPGNLSFGGKQAPAWYLAQWWCKNNLFDGERTRVGQVDTVKDCEHSLSLDSSSGALTLMLDGGVYYGDVPRVEGAWPHILIEQFYNNPNMLCDMTELRALTSFCPTRLVDRMGGKVDKNAHAAHVLWHFSVNNVNKDSSGYNDYLWIGLQLYDNRYDKVIEEYKCKDVGKADSTNKYIYSVASSDYMSSQPRIGETASIDIDILPIVRSGFFEAKSLGFLKDSSFEDMAIGTTNYGIEMTGIYELEFRIDSLSLLATTK